MLTVGDTLAKTLAKYQKITFWSKKNSFRCFFLLTTEDALSPFLKKFIDLSGLC